MTPFFPDITEQSVIDCTAGVRVMNRDHYIPLLKKLSPNCWALQQWGREAFSIMPILPNFL